jgi:hypothetical protein
MSTENTLRYLKLDFQSHRDALLQRVRARWPLVWNDFLNNSFGKVLVDLIAWSTATVSFLINRVASEMFVGSMTLRESAVRLGANYGYQLRGPTPAVVSCEATLTSAQSAAVTIAANTMIRTADASALPFEAVKDYVIAAGDLSPKELVVSIAPGLSGANTLAAYCRVTQDSSNVDLTDSAIDLTQYVQAGQVFQVSGETDEYVIQAIEAAPNALSNNRLVLDAVYAGATASVAATVYDKRIQFVQGQSVTDRFVSPTSETPNYAVKMSRLPVIENYASVTVNGETWSQVSNLAGSQATDKVFVVKTFTTGETVVQFGDNVFGMQIPTEAVIVADYRVGGGELGNVALNAINTSITGLLQSIDSPVTVTLKNQTSAGQGGRDAETLEEARTNIPYFVRTNDRAVTLDDYQTMAQLFTHAEYGSVAFARSAVRTENALLEGNVVSIYAWTTGSTGGLVNLSPQLKQAAKDYLQTKAVGTDYVQMLDGSAKPVPLSLRFKTFSGFGVPETKALVESVVRSTVNALRPGQPLIYSDLVRALDTTYGVDNVTMATPISDLSPSSSIELFTAPQPDYVYDLARNGVGSPVYSAADGYNISLYQAQLPVFPLLAWSFRLFLGTNELTVVPGLKPGEALLLGANLSTNTEQDSDKNYIYSSTVNLLTGKVQLWLVGAPGDLTMKLVPVTGYDSERVVNVYAGYDGDTTQTKRRDIRSALRSWSDNLSVGATLYGVPVAGVTSSASCVKQVIASVVGVDQVNRVALDTPGSTADRITALDYELLKLGNVIINNNVD